MTQAQGAVIYKDIEVSLSIQFGLSSSRHEGWVDFLPHTDHLITCATAHN